MDYQEVKQILRTSMIEEQRFTINLTQTLSSPPHEDDPRAAKICQGSPSPTHSELTISILANRPHTHSLVQ